MGWVLAAWLTACGGDAVTTHVALTRGAYEKNLTQSPVINDALIAGQAVGVTLLLKNLHKTHPKLATGIGIAATTWRFRAVHNNVGVIQQLRGQR